MKLTKYKTLRRGNFKKLAEELGISLSHLSQYAAGAMASPERCVDIERATNGLVSRQDLRPKDWHRIWPELKKRA